MKFIIVEQEGKEVTGYATSPYLIISNDRSKAKVFTEALDASLTAFALKKQNRKDCIVKMIEGDQ